MLWNPNVKKKFLLVRTVYAIWSENKVFQMLVLELWSPQCGLHWAFGMTDECGHVALAIGDLHWFSLALTGSHPVLACVSSLVFMTLQWWTSMVDLNGEPQRSLLAL